MDPFIASLDLDVLNAWNEDVDAPTFGTRDTVIRWRLMDRNGPGRRRTRPGYVMRRPVGSVDYTAPSLREYWTGSADA